MTPAERAEAERHRAKEDADHLRECVRHALSSLFDALDEDLTEAIDDLEIRPAKVAALRRAMADVTKAAEADVVGELKEEFDVAVFHRTEELDETIETLRDALDALIEAHGVDTREIRSLDGRWIGHDVIEALKRGGQ